MSLTGASEANGNEPISSTFDFPCGMSLLRRCYFQLLSKKMSLLPIIRAYSFLQVFFSHSLSDVKQCRTYHSFQHTRRQKSGDPCKAAETQWISE